MKVLVWVQRGGPGGLIVRDALAKGHSVVVLVRSKARAPEIVQVDAHYAVELSSIVDFQKGYSRGESAGAGFGVGTQ